MNVNLRFACQGMFRAAGQNQRLILKVIHLKSFVSLQLGRGAAVAYILTGVVVLLVLLYQRALYAEVEY